MVFCVTNYFAGFGINIVVPFNTIRALQLDLVDKLASDGFVQFGIMDREAWVRCEGLFVELFKVAHCASLVQAYYFIGADIGLGNTGSRSEGGGSEEGRHKFHTVFLLIDLFLIDS
ncbi:hypothetical protein ALP22_03272 [Pseudomonas coronafaciens pv. porri]|nr:hypothetical protein ALP22_03272 [Pseudomonas coronafaciens pv. porri]RMW02850.1 hypothetical protein ALO99_00637 [Pseudomonas coronafaciens pv. porri]